MFLDNLSQFNKRQFKKLLGQHIKEKRIASAHSQTALADALKCSEREIKLMEAGKKNLNQEQFNVLNELLHLDSNVLLDLSKITHVQYMMEIYKVIDEHFPC